MVIIILAQRRETIYTETKQKANQDEQSAKITARLSLLNFSVSLESH